MNMNIKIKEYIEISIKKNVFPGCVAFVMHDGKTDYYCFGNKQVFPSIEKTTTNTLYDIASLSKVIVTTTLIMLLVQEGKLSFETKIIDIIEQFRHPKVTIYHLLTHTSTFKIDYHWNNKTSSNQIIDDICFMDTLTEVGTKVVYSDLGYIILGEVIERIMQEPLDKVAQKYIFEPLHMYTATYNPKNKNQCAPTEYLKKRNIVKKGVVHDEKCELLKGVAGHAGVFMSIYDLEKYSHMLMGKKSLLSPLSLSLLSMNLTPLGEVNRGIGYLAKGKNQSFPKHCSSQSILHTGFTGTSLFIDFKNDVAIGVLSNRVHPSRKNNGMQLWRKEFHELVFSEYITKNKLK